MVKAIDVARWFLSYNQTQQHLTNDVEGISNLKLQKLLYYAQGCYVALYGEQLFEDDIVAWQHGPVIISVYEEYKKYHSNIITQIDEPQETFTQEVLSVLEWVYNEFGQYTAWALRNKTHNEAPWQETRINDVIEVEKIKRYFLEHYVEA